MSSQGERYRLLRKAGMSQLYFDRAGRPPGEGQPISERWARIQALMRPGRPTTKYEMMCIISYDIESNKVRRVIAKYLIRMGCQRVQKSVYMARIDRRVYQELAQTLKEIQAMYDNEDSIFLMPIGEEQMNRLQVIGRNLHIELITQPPHTLIL